MTTYKDVIKAINNILLTYQVHWDCSDLFQRLVWAQAFELSLREIEGIVKCRLQCLGVRDHDTKFAFSLQDASPTEADTFFNFLRTKCDKNVIRYQNTYVVDAENVLRLIEAFKKNLEELRKHNPGFIEYYASISESYPYFIKDTFEKQQLMREENNPYGKMMREIAIHLKNVDVSLSCCNIFPNTIMHMAGKHNTKAWGIESVQSPLGFYPRHNGKEIVFEYYKEQDPQEKLIGFLSKYTHITIERQPPNKVWISIKTADFYQDIMPHFRAAIAKTKVESPLLWADYVKFSKADPDLNEDENLSVAMNEKGQPVEDTSWPTGNIEFPASRPSRAGLFSSALRHVGRAIGCVHTEERGPTF